MHQSQNFKVGVSQNWLLYQTFGKSAHFQVPENGTSSARIQKLRPLFHANIPPKWWSRCFFCIFGLLSYKYNLHQVGLEFRQLFDILVHPRRHPGVGRLEGLLICQKTQSPRLRKTFNLLDIAFQLLHKCRPSHSKFHLKDVRQQTNWSDVRAFPSASTKVVGAHQTFQTIQNFNFKH